MRFYLSSFIFLLLFVSSALAIGASPARYQIDFTPGASYTFDYTISNNQNKPVMVKISLRGAFKDYATLSTDKLDLSNNLTGKFSLTLNLPEEWDKPGRNILRIDCVEHAASASSGFSARTAVVPDVVIHVPYPGKYAEISGFSVAQGKGGVNEGENTPVTFSIRSRGKEELVNTRAEVLLSDGNRTIEKLTYDDINIAPGATYSKSLTLQTADLLPSDYQATLNYYYTDVTRTRSVGFSVGEFTLDVLSYDENISINGIDSFNFKVKNKWKGKVFVEAEVSFDGLRAVKTSREQLLDFGTKSLSAYVDASRLELGPLNGTIKLIYSKESSSDATEVKIIPIHVLVVDSKSEEGRSFSLPISTTTLIVILALVIILVVNVVFLLKAFSHGKEKK